MIGPVLGVLANRRVLVAEDEYMIAEEIVVMLGEAGVEVLGPVPGVADGLNLLAAESRIDAALLDVNLRGEKVWPLVDALLVRSVPMVLTTGYDRDLFPVAYSNLPCCQKPANGQELACALARVLLG